MALGHILVQRSAQTLVRKVSLARIARAASARRHARQLLRKLPRPTLRLQRSAPHATRFRRLSLRAPSCHRRSTAASSARRRRDTRTGFQAATETTQQERHLQRPHLLAHASITHQPRSTLASSHRRSSAIQEFVLLLLLRLRILATAALAAPAATSTPAQRSGSFLIVDTCRRHIHSSARFQACAVCSRTDNTKPLRSQAAGHGSQTRPLAQLVPRPSQLRGVPSGGSQNTRRQACRLSPLPHQRVPPRRGPPLLRLSGQLPSNA